MNKIYSLRYTESGLIYMDSEDDCDSVVDAIFVSAYNEEFCISLDWNPAFIANLMKAGFLVMSTTVLPADDNSGETGKENPVPVEQPIDLVLPKLHLVRSALFFGNLHIKRSIRPFLSRYELRFDTEFKTIVDKCVQTHGEGWLTPSLIKSIFDIRGQLAPPANPRKLSNAAALAALVPAVYPLPVSFGLYRDGVLKAGEFGVLCGRVYTSYSGFKEENNAGTVQMILMIKALEEAGFDFLDFGMPLEYKTDLGAQDINPEQFVHIFRSAQL